MRHAPLAQVIRSGFVEGEHRGSAVALDADGSVVVEVGSPQEPMFPRSTAKPLQAAAMLHAGLRLDGALLALAASSHSGEHYHRDGVQRILAVAGLEPAALQNVPDLPLDTEERLVWQSTGRPATSVAQNCSGKHAAMLATCVENGWATATYRSPEHPLQVFLAETVAALTGEPISAVGIDGCGAPLFALSLRGLARAFARIAVADPGTAEGRVAAAIRTHPEWLGGTGREITVLVRGIPGLVAKDGAEGVYAAALPDGRAAAVKIADGAERARRVVLASLLRRLGVDEPVLDALADVPVLGHGEPVGRVEPVAF